MANVLTASNTTTEISIVSVQRAQQTSVTNIQQQILSHDLLKQVTFMN